MQQQRTERVELETTRHRITGDVTLAANGFRSRISDLLNASEREFLSLTDVELIPLDGGEPQTREYMAVSRQHIVYVTPLGGGPLPD
jgi:flavin-dependent dehydrogenase